MKQIVQTVALAAALSCAYTVRADNYVSEVWCPDLGNGYYKNPILYADYSDPDVCRVGEDYYMTSSSFNCIPGLQILHSKDLVNWEILSAAVPYALPPVDDVAPQHGNRVWAPSIRYHEGWFYIFWGDPDQGAFMTKSQDVAGRWTEPVLVKPGKGIIDTTPLWDDDGRVYMVHAYAGSRAGFKSVISICELNSEATKAITPSRVIFDGHGEHPTCEGPKFYKHDGYYYIFHPAGGVQTGWQVVQRSKNIYGPYEMKVTLAQGDTRINGPHQGAWVDTPTGEHWFLHFQDVGAYGRLVHLQPMKWVDGWPVMGVDKDGDGCGEPVLKHKKPNVGRQYPINNPCETDEFDGYELGKQWQWQANFNEKWHYCAGQKGVLRLFSYPEPMGAKSLWDVPNLLLQKPTAPNFTCTAKLSFTPSDKYLGERTGLVVMGMDYAGLIVENTCDGLMLHQVVCRDADRGKIEEVMVSVPLRNGDIYLRAKYIDKGLLQSNPLDMKVMVQFLYSQDGKKYIPLGEPFQAREGKWIGAKTGVFCTRPSQEKVDGGWVDVDFFRVTK